MIARLEEIQFWQMPTHANGTPGATDGEQWVVEARRDGRYHIVDRWIGTGLESVGRLFLDLTGLGDVEPVH